MEKVMHDTQTKVTDDPFIDDRKPPSKSVPIGDRKLKNANNRFHLIWKLAFKRMMLLLTKHAVNLSHLIRKFAFRKTILLRQSLPPNLKVHIQESNTAAQQKCRQSLSPDSKACIQETKVIDIDQTTEEFLRGTFYMHSTLPLVYYHCCSIDPRASTRLIWSVRLSGSLSNTF